MVFAVMIPGQGSQFRGMGQDLVPRYPGLMRFASELLGYDLVALCRDDPDGYLAKTEYTQPVLFVINALRLFERERDEKRASDYFLGHSLGEYNALLAAGVFDFETGLLIVRRRAELMAQAVGGGMTAVMNITETRLTEIFTEDGVEGVDVAAYNTDKQMVIAAPLQNLGSAHSALRNRGVRFVPLQVGGAFHSRYMKVAQREFSSFLQSFSFGAPQIPVISNVTARPHDPKRIHERLTEQLVESVRWTDSIRYLMSKGEALEHEEVGGKDLTGMVKQISAEVCRIDGGAES